MAWSDNGWQGAGVELLATARRPARGGKYEVIIFCGHHKFRELRVNGAQFLQYTVMFLSQSVDTEHVLEGFPFELIFIVNVVR